MATWLAIIVAALKLLGSLAQIASDTRAANESAAAALQRVLVDAQNTIKDADDARAAARASADSMQHTDEWTRSD